MENKKLSEYENLGGDFVLYSLTTPEDINTVYIGITSQENLLLRLFDHFYHSVSLDSDKNINKASWVYKYWRTIDIKKLKDSIPTKEEAVLIEAETIFEYRDSNYNVLNDTYVAVNAYDINGNFIKTFPSYLHVFKELGVKTTQVAKSIYTGGYCNDKYKFLKYEYSSCKNLNNIGSKQENFKIKGKDKIFQFDLEGNLIKEWNNKTSIATFYKIDRSYLNRLIEKKKIIKDTIFIESSCYISPINIKEYSEIKTKINNNITLSRDNEDDIHFEFINDCVNYLLDNNLTKTKDFKTIKCNIRKSIEENKSYLKMRFKI